MAEPAAHVVTAPPTPDVPDVPAGEVLHFPAGQWCYGGGDLRLRVAKVRVELARYYGGAWVWIDGDRLAPDGTSLGQIQALVQTEALVRAVAAHISEAEVSP